MANTYDFNITQGTSFLVFLNAENSDGSSINLSGYNTRGYVKNQYGDNFYLYNLNPTTIYPLESGIVAISGNSTGTMLLPAGSFLYDIEIYNGFNSIKILNGDFNVFPSTSIKQPTGILEFPQ